MKAEIVGIAVALLIFVGTEESKLLDSYPLAKHSLDAVLLVVSLGLLFHGLKEPVVARVGRLLRPAPPAVPASQPADEWMTLADAARAALSEASTLLDATTRGMAKDEGRLLAIWAYRVTAQIGVPLYGSRVLSSKRQIVPMEEPITFRDEATRVSVGNGGPTNDFVNLMVKRSDLEVGLAEVNRPREPGE